MESTSSKGAHIDLTQAAQITFVDDKLLTIVDLIIHIYICLESLITSNRCCDRVPGDRVPGDRVPGDRVPGRPSAQRLSALGD